MYLWVINVGTLEADFNMDFSSKYFRYFVGRMDNKIQSDVLMQNIFTALNFMIIASLVTHL